MRNCQQNECLKRDQVDPLYPRQTQDPCLLPPWRQGHFLAEARRLNLGMWVRRGWNCFGWPNLGHTLFCLEATEGLRPWALLKGNKHRPRTQICVSMWLQTRGTGVALHIPVWALSGDLYSHHDLQWLLLKCSWGTYVPSVPVNKQCKVSLSVYSTLSFFPAHRFLTSAGSSIISPPLKVEY